MFWEKKSLEEIRQIILEKPSCNLAYSKDNILGFPGSFLDQIVFPNLPYLDDIPYLKYLREKPNHIECHTLTPAKSLTASYRQSLESEK